MRAEKNVEIAHIVVTVSTRVSLLTIDQNLQYEVCYAHVSTEQHNLRVHPVVCFLLNTQRKTVVGLIKCSQIACYSFVELKDFAVDIRFQSWCCLNEANWNHTTHVFQAILRSVFPIHCPLLTCILYLAS